MAQAKARRRQLARQDFPLQQMQQMPESRCAGNPACKGKISKKMCNFLKLKAFYNATESLAEHAD